MNEEMYYWEKLIDFWVNVKHKNGLSIPFILGAKTLIDNRFRINENSVNDLMTEIRNFDNNSIITLQFCDNINEYVLGINDPLFPKVGLEILNEKTNKTRIIATLNTYVLGNNFNELSKALTSRYHNCLNEQKFSRIDFDWAPFTENDLKLINEAFNS